MKLEQDFRKLSPKMRLYYRTLFKKDFYSFAKYFWCEADPAPFVDGILVQFYCEFFQYLCRPWIGYDGPWEEPVIPDANPGEYYLVNNVSDLKAGDKISCEGFMYVYEKAQLHTTSVTVVTE